MPKHKFSEDNQPKRRAPRSVGERKKILQALERAGVSEEGFYDILVDRAVNNPDDNFALDNVMKRLMPIRKSVMPNVEFEFNKDGTPAEQVSQILDAISNADVPPDIGSLIINSIKSAVEVEESTDLKARIEAIEAMLGE